MTHAGNVFALADCEKLHALKNGGQQQHQPQGCDSGDTCVAAH